MGMTGLARRGQGRGQRQVHRPAGRGELALSAFERRRPELDGSEGGRKSELQGARERSSLPGGIVSDEPLPDPLGGRGGGGVFRGALSVKRRSSAYRWAFSGSGSVRRRRMTIRTAPSNNALNASGGKRRRNADREPVD